MHTCHATASICPASHDPSLPYDLGLKTGASVQIASANISALDECVKDPLVLVLPLIAEV